MTDQIKSDINALIDSDPPRTALPAIELDRKASQFSAYRRLPQHGQDRQAAPSRSVEHHGKLPYRVGNAYSAVRHDTAVK